MCNHGREFWHICKNKYININNIYIYSFNFFCVFVFQASNTVEVNIETAEKLLVSRLDFMASLNNDIKPVSPVLC